MCLGRASIKSWNTFAGQSDSQTTSPISDTASTAWTLTSSCCPLSHMSHTLPCSERLSVSVLALRGSPVERFYPTRRRSIFCCFRLGEHSTCRSIQQHTKSTKLCQCQSVAAISEGSSHQKYRHFGALGRACRVHGGHGRR